MKKIFIMLMLLAISGIAIQKSFADDALGQAQQASDDGQAAVNSTSDEGAASTAGMGFDTPSTTPPPVDLRGVENPTPALLRNQDGTNPYTPKQYQSLHTNPPPPLP